jgi:hypothetical protein
MNMIKIAIFMHTFTTSRYHPMECLNIDFVGPFPMEDMFTLIHLQDVVLKHAKEATAKEAAQHLLEHFGRFGVPTQLRSDRGSHL